MKLIRLSSQIHILWLLSLCCLFAQTDTNFVWNHHINKITNGMHYGKIWNKINKAKIVKSDELYAKSILILTDVQSNFCGFFANLLINVSLINKFGTFRKNEIRSNIYVIKAILRKHSKQPFKKEVNLDRESNCKQRCIMYICYDRLRWRSADTSEIEQVLAPRYC